MAAIAKQWLHRAQVARRKARDTATERGMLHSSTRFSLEGQAIASVVEALSPEVEQLVESHLKAAITAADLPSPDQLQQAVEPIRALIESQIADLRSSPKRHAFPGSGICDGTITAAVAGIEPALEILRSRIEIALQNRKAELISVQIAAEAATTKNASDVDETDSGPSLVSPRVRRTVEWMVRQLQAVRPKFYNGITWALVTGGLLLMGRPLWEQIIEQLVHLEFDIQITGAGNDVGWGFALIIAGLLYSIWHRAQEAASPDQSPRANSVSWFARPLFLGMLGGGLTILAGAIWLQQARSQLSEQFDTQRMAIVAANDAAIRQKLDDYTDRYLADAGKIDGDSNIDVCTEGTAYAAASAMLERIDTLAQDLSDGGLGYREFVRKRQDKLLLRTIGDCETAEEQ